MAHLPTVLGQGATVNEILTDVCTHERDRLFCKVIFRGGEHPLTYGNLYLRTSDYTAEFKRHGVSKGDNIIIILNHSIDLVCSFIGAIIIGAIPSIIPPPSEKQHASLYTESILKLTERIQAKVIVTYEENKVSFQQLGLGNVVVLVDTTVPHDSRHIQPIACDPSDIVLLQHSSGTTGHKKGVALSHRAVINQVRDYSHAISLDEKTDVIISWLPLYHDMGLIACFLLPLLTKTRLILISPFDWVYNPAMLFEQIEKNKGTLCWLPNFAFNFLAQRVDKQYDLSSMRAFINCSEPCKLHSFQMFENKFHVGMEKLQTCYAMAENVYGVTQSPMGSPVHVDWVDAHSVRTSHIAKQTDPFKGFSFLSCGPPIDNTSVKVVDEKMKELPERHIGEITITGTSLFSGYFRLQKETEEVLQRGWYYTGDMGYIAEKNVYITGRKKDIIIVHGKNYYAHDIEYYANHVEGVKAGRSVAISVYDDRTGTEDPILIAETAIVGDEPMRAIQRNVKNRVKEALDLTLNEVYLVPQKWLVKTTSGKISRKENLEKYLAEKVAAHAGGNVRP